MHLRRRHENRNMIRKNEREERNPQTIERLYKENILFIVITIFLLLI